MKKWQVLEDKINEKLEKSISKAQENLSVPTPDRIKSFSSHMQNFKTHLKSSPHQLRQKIESTKAQVAATVESAKVKLHEAQKSAKSGKYSKLGVAATVIAFFEWALMPFYKKLAALFATLQPTTIATGVIVMTVGTITGIGVYQNSQKIAEEAGIIDRAPAAIETVSQPRPRYYKRNERELLVANVVIPSYIEGTTALRKLQVDFTVISSNRYIREYFFDNAYLVEDVFHSRIEPMVPGFPLGDEGKQILKEKIQAELNNLLKEMKIEGTIESVYISALLAA